MTNCIHTLHSQALKCISSWVATAGKDNCLDDLLVNFPEIPGWPLWKADIGLWILGQIQDDSSKILQKGHLEPWQS